MGKVAKMAATWVGSKVNREIVTALGIKNCKRFVLRMAVGEITTVETECFPDERELEGLPDILKKYRLEEIKEVGRTQLALSSIMKQLTWKIKIVGECQWWLRRTIALLMMRFAVWSTGMKAEISLKDEAVKGD
jgi:hypothetical protein